MHTAEGEPVIASGRGRGAAGDVAETYLSGGSKETATSRRPVGSRRR